MTVYLSPYCSFICSHAQHPAKSLPVQISISVTSECSFKKCSSASGHFIFYRCCSVLSFGAVIPPRDKRYLSARPSSNDICASASMQASYTATRWLIPNGGTQKLYCLLLPSCSVSSIPTKTALWCGTLS